MAGDGRSAVLHLQDPLFEHVLGLAKRVEFALERVVLVEIEFIRRVDVYVPASSGFLDLYACYENLLVSFSE